MGIRAALERGPLRGVFQVLPAVAATEAIAAAGAGFVVLDGEHAPFGVGDLAGYARAGELAGVPVLYRAESADAALGKALDSGIAGVVVPRIESAAQARRLVEATRFPPLGARGLGAGRAAGHGASMQGLLESANREVLVVAMIETAAGLEALDEIVGVDGVDAVLVGPTDLAASLGVRMGSPEHDAAIERVVGAAVAAGRIAGVHCADEAQARWAQQRGANFISLGLDAVLLTAAVRSILPGNEHGARAESPREAEEGSRHAASD